MKLLTGRKENRIQQVLWEQIVQDQFKIMDNEVIITEMLQSIQTFEDDSKPPDIFQRVTLSKNHLGTCILQGEFFRQNTGKSCKLIMFDSYLLLNENGLYHRMELDLSIVYDFNKKNNHFWFQYFNQDNCKLEIFTPQTFKLFDQWVTILRSKLPRMSFHNNYKIITKESSGKNSIVYKISRLSDGKIFAAKATSVNSSVEQEIRILSIIDHPNLINFKEFYVQPDNAYIIMDYENGGTLLDLIRDKEPLSSKQRVKVYMDVLNGLEFLRIKGLVHRDLKPENIVYNKDDGNYKIADFGLAMAINQPFTKIVGTPGYIAPEVLRRSLKSKISDLKSDIYSAGLIFYQLITKEPLYKGKNTNQILKNNMKGKSTKHIKHQSINDLEKQLLNNMLRSSPQKRNNSYQILKSPVINKLSHILNARDSSMTNSTRKSNSNDSEQQASSKSFINAFKNLLKIRSSSN